MNLRYYSNFRDINDNSYRVNIYTNQTASAEELTLSADPLHINYVKDGDIFKPVVCSGCTLTFLSKNLLSDLYTGKILDVYILILKNNLPYWNGYNSPNIYSLEYYSDADEVRVEGIDGLSALEYFKYKTTTKGVYEDKNFKYIIFKILKKVSSNPTVVLLNNSTNWLNEFYISERNFFDELEEGMSMKSVLEHIMRFLDCSLYYINNVYYIIKNKVSSTVSGFTITESSSSTTSNTVNTVNSTVAENDCTVSLGDVYNKMNVVCNTLSIDKTEKIIGIYDYEGLVLNGGTTEVTDSEYKYYLQNFNSTILLQYNYKETETIKNSVTYPDASGDEGAIVGDITVNNYNYSYNSDNSLPNYNGDYLSATFTRLAEHKKDEAYPNPTWDLYITCNQGRVDGGLNYLKRKVKNDNLPLLYYKTAGKLGYLNSSKSSVYIVIGGSAKLSNTYYDSKNASALSSGIIKDGDSGYKVLDAKLRIGNKYWDGSNWTTTNCTFPFKVGTSDGINTETWYNVTNTVDYTLELGCEGLQIEIKKTDNLSGYIEFWLYPYKFSDSDTISGDKYGVRSDNGFLIGWDESGSLSSLPVSTTYSSFKSNSSMWDAYRETADNSEESAYDITYYYTIYNFNGIKTTPYVLIRNLDFQFKSLVGDFFDTEENEELDIIYTNLINDEYVKEGEDILMYVNSYNPNYHTALSYSFVKNSSNDYVEKIDNKRPEEVVLQNYTEHFSSPKLIYSNSIVNNNIKPFDKVNAVNKTMAISDADYDVRYNKINLTLKEL